MASNDLDAFLASGRSLTDLPEHEFLALIGANANDTTEIEMGQNGLTLPDFHQAPSGQVTNANNAPSPWKTCSNEDVMLSAAVDDEIAYGGEQNLEGRPSKDFTPSVEGLGAEEMMALLHLGWNASSPTNATSDVGETHATPCEPSTQEHQTVNENISSEMQDTLAQFCAQALEDNENALKRLQRQNSGMPQCADPPQAPKQSQGIPNTVAVQSHGVAEDQPMDVDNPVEMTGMAVETGGGKIFFFDGSRQTFSEVPAVLQAIDNQPYIPREMRELPHRAAHPSHQGTTQAASSNNQFVVSPEFLKNQAAMCATLHQLYPMPQGKQPVSQTTHSVPQGMYPTQDTSIRSPAQDAPAGNALPNYCALEGVDIGQNFQNYYHQILSQQPPSSGPSSVGTSPLRFDPVPARDDYGIIKWRAFIADPTSKNASPSTATPTPEPSIPGHTPTFLVPFPTHSSPSHEISAVHPHEVSVYSINGYRLAGPEWVCSEASTGEKRRREGPAVVVDDCKACMRGQRDATKLDGVPLGSVLVNPCQWTDQPCHLWIGGTRTRLEKHFSQHHGVSKTSQQVECQWPGCREEMEFSFLGRHIAAHLRILVRCEGCDMDYSRPDALKRHNCIGGESKKKTVPDVYFGLVVPKHPEVNFAR